MSTQPSRMRQGLENIPAISMSGEGLPSPRPLSLSWFRCLRTCTGRSCSFSAYSGASFSAHFVAGHNGGRQARPALLDP
jgi:hypothetical protein